MCVCLLATNEIKENKHEKDPVSADTLVHRAKRGMKEGECRRERERNREEHTARHKDEEEEQERGRGGKTERQTERSRDTCFFLFLCCVLYCSTIMLIK